MLCYVSAAISASEAIERTQKTEHDNQMLTMSIRNLENENRVIQGENKRLKDELTEEKKKHRGVHVDKLGVERKISELSAEKNRLEVKGIVFLSLSAIIFYEQLNFAD